ncbi:MAG: hypothetical protein WD071_04275 [Pseudohongiella sp.]|uniref:hypothetical protein n=1 Tax=Pseudohongiella sp. TaxID=1979412 RepID=UPI0034A0802A
MRELSKEEVNLVAGGNPVLVMAAYVTVRYAARQIGAAVATGALTGATGAYLENNS